MIRLPALGFALLLALAFAVTANAQFPSGHVYVTDYNQSKVYDYDPGTGNWTVFADSSDGIVNPSAIGFNSAGKMLVSNYGSSTVVELDDLGNGKVVLDSGDGLNGPWGENGIALDALDRVYVANYNVNQILRFDSDYTNGVVFADAADGIVQPDGMGFVANGDLLVANRSSGGNVLRIDSSGNTTLWDTIGGEDCFSLVVRDNGDVYVACLSGNVFRYLNGDPGQRKLFGTWGSSNPGLRFSPDFSVLYHVSYLGDELRAIDPDTGSDTVLLSGPGWGAIGIAVSGGQYSPGSFSNFGNGLAGEGGFVPSLHGVGLPKIGTDVTLETRDFVGGARTYLLVSMARNDVPAFGGTIYPSFQAPYLVFLSKLPGAPGVGGEGDVDTTLSLPAVQDLVGTNWYFQQFAVDAAAVQGMSMSEGLRMFVGE